MPFPQHALVLAKDPMQATTALHYNECREDWRLGGHRQALNLLAALQEALLASGWYLPPGWGSDGLYSGLHLGSKPTGRCQGQASETKCIRE